MPNSVARRALVSLHGKSLSASVVLSLFLALALPVSAQPSESLTHASPAATEASQRLSAPFANNDLFAARLQNAGVAEAEAVAIEAAIRKTLDERQRGEGAEIELAFVGTGTARAVDTVAIRARSGNAITLTRASIGLPALPQPATAPASEPHQTTSTGGAAPAVTSPIEATAKPAAPAASLPAAPSGHVVRDGVIAGMTVERSIAATGVPGNIAKVVATAIRRHPELRGGVPAGTRFAVAFEPYLAAESRFAVAAVNINGRDHRIWRFSPNDTLPGYFTDRGERVAGLNLVSPMPGIAINSPYGMRRHPVLRVAKMHWGVDYPAPAGTPIYAAADGVITDARRNGNYGLFMQIDHGHGVATTYGHMQKFAPGKKPGTRVKAGEVIAHVGRTGLATGNHLYFEVFLGDRRIDPETVWPGSETRLAGADLEAFERFKQQGGSTEIAARNGN